MVINVAMSTPTVCLYEIKFYYVFLIFVYTFQKVIERQTCLEDSKSLLVLLGVLVERL